MLLEYYKLAEQPFGVTPDSRFLYLGPKHREALASLVYGTESNRGFLALIAKPGMGKTSLLYHYLSYLRDKARTAFVFRTDCDSREFIRHLLLDLGIDVAGMDLPAMHDTLNRLLTEEMRAGRRFVLVIDEAQNLDEKVLESIRLLSNFETPWTKLMQIVLAGQPQLADRLASPSMAQLRQRVSMVIRIEPLTNEEVNAYIDHRLWIAGCEKPAFLTVGARKLIADHSEGIPRNINNLCFNAMSLACALQRKIDRSRHRPRRDCGPGSRAVAREKHCRGEARKEIGARSARPAVRRKKTVSLRRLDSQARDHQRSVAGCGWPLRQPEPRRRSLVHAPRRRCHRVGRAASRCCTTFCSGSCAAFCSGFRSRSGAGSCCRFRGFAHARARSERHGKASNRGRSREVRSNSLSNQREQIWQVRRQGPRGIARTEPFAR